VAVTARRLAGPVQPLSVEFKSNFDDECFLKGAVTIGDEREKVSASGCGVRDRAQLYERPDVAKAVVELNRVAPPGAIGYGLCRTKVLILGGGRQRPI
jgi:hypothetical protein